LSGPLPLPRDHAVRHPSVYQGTDAVYHALNVYAMLKYRERVLDETAELLSVPSNYSGVVFHAESGV
jgi:hypothetical protein